MTTLFIKNMVCRRCVLAVEQVVRESGYTPRSVELGRAVLEEDLGAAALDAVRQRLEALGFALLDDRRHRQVEQVRAAVIAFVRECAATGGRLSDFVSARCGREYSVLSKLFSETEGVSVEQYYLAQRLELAKELLVYDELGVSEIAVRLGFSSTAHFSAQFRRLTGLTPSDFRRQHGRRCGLDEVVAKKV